MLLVTGFLFKYKFWKKGSYCFFNQHGCLVVLLHVANHCFESTVAIIKL